MSAGDRDARATEGQRGAALIIVLVLVATLSFIALGMTAASIASARRTLIERTRQELIWRAIGAEAAAMRLLLSGAEEGGDRRGLERQLFSAPFPIETPRGVAAIRFADASRCFNVNVFAERPTEGGGRDEANGADGRRKDNEDQFTTLIEELGFAEADAVRLLAVLSDWVDEGGVSRPQGAEDGFYTGLPVPFRTGDGPLGDVSELRAMEGVSATLYAGVAPFLCAPPSIAPVKVNLNAVSPREAPLIVALTKGAVSRLAVEDVIAARPPGGYATASEFWSSERFRGFEADTSFIERTSSVTSEYIEARVGLRLNEVDMEYRLIFSVAGQQPAPTLISRRLGAD